MHKSLIYEIFEFPVRNGENFRKINLAKEVTIVIDIDVYQLNIDDAEKLDILFSACAEAAVKEAQKKPANKKKAGKRESRVKAYHREEQEFLLNKEGIDILYSCYKSSKFLHPSAKHQSDIKYRLGYELGRRTKSDCLPCLELLFPIMAYTMIINNEYNLGTVSKRIPKDEYKDNPEKRNKWKRVDLFSIKRSTKPPASKEFDKRVKMLNRAIAATGRRDLNKKPCVHQIYAFLRRYKLVMKQQDCAKIALFLRDILLKSYRKDQPMDTLIRMYLANRLDGLLIRSSCLLTGERRKYRGDLTNNNILSQYVMCCQDPKVDQIIQQATGISFEIEDAVKQKLDISIPSDIDKMEFTDIYRWITNQFSISEDSLAELFDLYFNEACLLKICNLYDTILEHANNMIADIKSNAQTTDRWLDPTLEKLYYNTSMWKGDIGPVKKYRTIPSDNVWSGDRSKRMDMKTMTTNKPIYEKWFK